MRAIALAIALVSGCRVLPLHEGSAYTERSAVVSWRIVDALWFRQTPGQPAKYGATRVRATVAPNPDDEVRVGVLEEYLGATGTQWRSSVWVAAFLAAHTLGHDLTRYRFNIAVGGFIDGPSAGALMAAGFMAAITGEPVRAEVTITGALAPDGSIAPVDGIPEKIRAAVAVGKKVIGIPAGQARSRSTDGQPVDSLTLGRELGVEVREVWDLYDAYALLTGKELPRPRALPTSQMEVPPEVSSRLRERIRKLFDRAAADALAEQESQVAAVRQALGALEVARREAAEYLARSDVAAAYLRAVRAAALAQAAVLVDSLARHGKRFRASLQRVDASLADLEKNLAAMAESPGARALALLSGYSGAARARGFLEVARLLTGGAGKSARARRSLRDLVRTGRAFLPAIYVSYADLAAEIGRDAAVLGGSIPTRLRFDPEVLRRMAQSYVSASTGNLEYIDALLLAEVAEEQKKSVETVRMAFGINEPAYLLAMQLAEMALLGEVSGPATVGSRLSRLAAAAMSYVESALIVAKYYSLEAAVPERAPPEDVRRKRPLLALLARSELAARRAAAWAVSRIGVVPPEAQLYYRAGASLVGGSVREKLRALGFFWQSTVASNVAAMVMRR